MTIKKYVLYEDLPNPSLQKINVIYRAQFSALDFNKIACIRFMKTVTKIGDGYEIPMYYDRFQVFGFNEIPDTPDNYITWDQLWDSKYHHSLLVKAN